MVMQSFWFQVRWWDISKEKHNKKDVFMCYVHITKEESAVCVQLNRALNHDLDKQIWCLYHHACCQHCPVGLHWGVVVMYNGHGSRLRQDPELSFLDWYLLAFTSIRLDQVFQISQQLSLCPLALHKITHLEHMLWLLVIWFSYTCMFQH